MNKSPHKLTRTVLLAILVFICHCQTCAQQISQQRLREVLVSCGSIRTLSHYRTSLSTWGVEEKLPFATPIYASYTVSSLFGIRMHPIKKRRLMHNGYDLSCPLATRIHATADGVVSYCGWRGGYGNCVVVRHLYGFETLYGHMSRTRAYVGKRVSRGDVIGFVGSTGLSTGYHLHYEVRKNGTAIEPFIP